MITALAVVATLMAPEYLTEVVGEPVTTTGTVAEISLRAETCAAQVLDSGAAGGQVVLSSDHAAGVVVASNALEYRDGLAPYRLRSRVTIEAREGRFRISHTAIERHNDQSFGAQMLGATPWGPVGKWWGSGWQKAEGALKGVSDRLSACIATLPAAGNDW